MQVTILPSAERAIAEIWLYTDRVWGEGQADAYVEGLCEAVLQVAAQRHRWKRVDDKIAPGVLYFRYEHHFVFFRQLSRTRLGIISVLHESMDIPHRLLDDLDDPSSE